MKRRFDAPGPRGGFWRELVLYAVLNSAIAVVLTWSRFGGTLWENWVFSQLIGLSIVVLVDGGRRWLWPGRAPAMPGFLALLVGGIALGVAVGVLLGSWLLGVPLSTWSVDAAGALKMALLVALVATSLASYHGWTRQRMAELREAQAREALRHEAAEKQAVRAQLQVLQAQVEPHFLFNTLAHLDALIAEEPARARVLLAHLNRFLRASLMAVRAERGTLRDEFVVLDAWLAIQQIRFGERLRYRLTLPPDCADLPWPPMLLQPLVENAVKHGIEPMPEGGTVAVIAECTAQVLSLTVRDDGAGFGGAPSRGTGVGLSNIRDRLAALYGERARLTLHENQPRGVVAALSVPL